MLKYILGLAIIGLFWSCNQPGKQTTETTDTTKSVTDPALARLDALNSRIANDSLNPELYNERAKFYLDNAEFSQAFKDIRTALDIDSSYSEYYLTLADVYLGMGKLKKTGQSLEKAIHLDSKNVNAYLQLAELSIVIRDYKKALIQIDKALKIDELASKGYLLRGVVMLETGDTIKGIRNLQRAIDVNQDYFEAHVQLGMLYAGKNNKLAVDYFNNALNIQPNNMDVMYALAMYYQNNGEYENAVSKYKSILEIDPSFFIAYYNMGYIYLVYLKDYDQAIEYFTKAIDLQSDYADAYYNRGFAWELKNNVNKAREDYKNALKYQPNYEKAIEGLNRIDVHLSGK